VQWSPGPPTTPLPASCLATQLSSTLLSIPSAGTENDDRNPSRVRARSLLEEWVYSQKDVIFVRMQTGFRIQIS